MYRLLLLGGATLEGAAGPLSGRVVQRRQLGLLSLLACASGRPLTREKAIGLLWGDGPESRARRLLSDTLYVIRHNLGSEAILDRPDGLRLNGDVVWSDVTAFEEALAREQWQEAVALYGGPFLDGFHLDGAGEFERWSEGERARLTDGHRKALHALAEGAEARGDWSEAVTWWKRRAADERTNSWVAVRLMKALAAAGSVAGALEHARVHETLLRQELGLPPSDAVRELANTLAQQAEESGAPTASETEEPPAGVPAPGSGAPLGDAPSEPAVSPPAAVSPTAAGSPTEPEGSSPKPRSFSSDPVAPRPAGPWKGWGSGAAAGGILLSAFIAVGLFVWAGPLLESRGTSDGDDAGPTLAVLPFENLGAPDEGHVADGITEELTVRLASVADLRVIARASALHFQDQGDDIRNAGDALGADYVVDGAVRPRETASADGRVRVSAQLIRAADGTHVWAGAYDRDPAELMAIQDEITEQVARELDLADHGPEAESFARERTDEPAAYDHYLQGNAYTARQFSRESADAAIAQYEQAVELDPGFAAAWRRLVQTRVWLAWVFDDTDAGVRAGDDLDRLLELGDDQPEVLLGRAWHRYYGERNYEAALRDFERVLEDRPGDAEALRAVGLLEMRLGRWEEGVATSRETLELNPRDIELTFGIAQSLRGLGRYDEAEEYYDRAFDLSPDEDLGFIYPNLEHLHLARGDTARAREVWERGRELGAGRWRGGRAELHREDLHAAVERIREAPATTLTTRMYRYDNLAYAHALLGDEEHQELYADSLLEAASELAPDDWDVPRRQDATLGWVFVGLALIHLGDPEAGLGQVERALSLEEQFDDAITAPDVETWAARAFARAGRHEEALDLLESARVLPGAIPAQELRHDPEWEPFRSDPRFQRLLEEDG